MKLTESVRSGGLLIWLDREHQYTALVDSWITEGPSGSLPCEDFAYRASFLELMASSRKNLSQEQVEHLLAREFLRLEVAEAYVYKEEKVPLEGKDGLVLRFIEAPEEITREMCVDQKHGFLLLTEYLLTLIELHYQWRVDWNQNFEEHHGGDSQVELLLSCCMAMEYVHVLKSDARSERLSRLGEKPKEYEKISRAILRKLRESKPEL